MEKDKCIEMNFVVYRPDGTITEDELTIFIDRLYEFLNSMGLTGGGGMQLVNTDGSKEEAIR